MSKQNEKLDNSGKTSTELVLPWAGQLTDFVAPHPSWGIVRGLATALAISGFPFAILNVFFPHFWLGYLVWGGWIAIACGVHGAHNRWFWSASAVWNLGVMVFLFSPGLNPFSLIYVHSFAAMTVSFAMVLLLFTSQRPR